MNKKIQIRQINDIQGRSYKIYDLMYLNKNSVWVSAQDYETLEDALKWNPGTKIEDKTEVSMNNKVRFLSYDGLESEQDVSYTYDIGETIIVNSYETYKCVSIELIDSGTVFIFKQGKVVLDFNW